MRDHQPWRGACARRNPRLKFENLVSSSLAVGGW